ncbi:MAG: BON domain-containing protein [Chromatiales bacterium]|jgi:osmotically-inducible protein OsmY
MEQPERVKAVRAAIESTPGIDARTDTIEIRFEDALELDGDVRDIAAKRRAVRAAQAAGGTTSVADRLRVRVADPRPDGWMHDRALQMLRAEPVFGETRVSGPDEAAAGEGSSIRVSVSEGVIRLEGEVGSLSHRRVAEVLCWWIPGCRDVDNRLHVVPPERDNDGEITDAVRLVLEKSAGTDAAAIRVQTRDQAVTLSGTVHSRPAADEAVLNCWRIPGVHEVHDQLEVRPGQNG